MKKIYVGLLLLLVHFSEITAQCTTAEMEALIYQLADIDGTETAKANYKATISDCFDPLAEITIKGIYNSELEIYSLSEFLDRMSFSEFGDSTDFQFRYLSRVAAEVQLTNLLGYTDLNTEDFSPSISSARVEFYLRTGLVFSSYTAMQDYNSNFTTPGIYSGVGVKSPSINIPNFPYALTIGLEALYSQRSIQVNQQDSIFGVLKNPENEILDTYQERITEITFPFYVQLEDIFGKLDIQFGIYTSYQLQTTIATTLEDRDGNDNFEGQLYGTFDLKEDYVFLNTESTYLEAFDNFTCNLNTFEVIDFGGFIGGGYQINQRISADFRYVFGLRDVNRTESCRNSDFDFRTQSLTLGLRLNF